MRMQKGLLGSVAVLAIAASPMAASAQETGASAQATADGSSPNDTGDIIVTAQRTESLASKTPIALSAISGDALRSAGVTNPTNLGDQVPNLSIVRNNGLQITIRGVSSNDTTEKGDPSAAFLLDGVYIARPAAQEVSFFDVARVEVLRGPQGTLYGRNTTAGVVNVITNRPSDRFEMAGNIGYGNYDAIQGDAMVNIPVNEMVALRFSGSYDRRDSYLIANPGDSHDLNPFKNNLSGRAQALFTFSDSVNLLLRADYSRIRNSPFVSVLAKNYYAPLPAGSPGYTDPTYIGGSFSSSELRQVGFNQINAPRSNSNSWGIDGELNWDLGPLAMTYLGSYRKFKADDDFTILTGIPARFIRNPRSSQVSQELRFATTDTGPLKAQFGGYYFNEEGSNTAFILNLLPAYPYYGFVQRSIKAENYGIFGQATYSFTDRLRATGGVRYSHDKKLRVGGTVMQRGPVFDPATDRLTPNDATVTSSKVTWRAGLDYDLNSRSLLYGSVSTGYKAGGFNEGCAAGTPNCLAPRPENALYYRPEELTAYEVGFKTRFAQNAVRLNGSLFYYDYNNLQVSSVVDQAGVLTTLVTNAAKARIKGVELEGIVTPSKRNRFDASFAWLDAEYKSFYPLGENNPPDYAGRPLDRSPQIVVSVGYTYIYPFENGASLAFSARSRLSDDYVITAQSVARQYRQPSFTRTDLSLTFSAPDDRFYLQGYVHNLENEITVTNISLVSGRLAVTPSDPRTYGVRAGFKF